MIQGVGREIRIVPSGPAGAVFAGVPVAEYTDRDDEREITIPMSIKMRARLIRE